MMKRSYENISQLTSGFWATLPKLMLVFAVFLSFPDLADRFLLSGYTRFDQPESWNYDVYYQELTTIGKIWHQSVVFLFLYGLALFLTWHLPSVFLLITALGLVDLFPIILESRYFEEVNERIALSSDWADLFHWTAMTKLYPPWLAMVICLALLAGWLWFLVKRYRIFR